MIMLFIELKKINQMKYILNKILITGLAGFIGASVVKKLYKKF